MLLLLENNFCLPAFIVVLIHFFSSFGELTAIELPLELLHQGVNGAKSMDFTRHITFPLTNSNNGAELLPPTVEDNMELKTPNVFANTAMEDNDNLEDDLPIKSGMPKWLQIQMQQQPEETHQHANNHHHSNMLTKHTLNDKHHSDGRQIHNTAAVAAAPSLRRCSIEISSKIPGICQAMGSIGNACVSGDYVDVFNAECL